MENEVKSASDADEKMRQILSEYLAGVIKLEGLVEVGRRFLVCFQQAIEFLRRPSLHDASELIQSIVKRNETSRVKSYVEAGCKNAYDSTHSVTQMNTSVSELQDHLIKAKAIVTELEVLMDKAGSILQAMSENLADQPEMDFSETSEGESTSESRGIPLHKSVSLDASNCSSYMAVIHSMVKQDYVMQEKIVSSLSLKSSSGELDSYCLMWSLRPFVNEDIILEAVDKLKS